MTHDEKAVLVVDDDADLRDALAIALELDGFEVVTALNGQDALEKLRRMPKLHAIVLDLLMPIMNGWEFLDASAHDPAATNVPVVVLSSFGELEELPRAATFVEKPFDLNELLRVVRLAQPGVIDKSFG